MRHQLSSWWRFLFPKQRRSLVKSQLIELARLIQQSESPAELLGSLREWAANILHPGPADPDEKVSLAIPGDRIFNYRQDWALTHAQQYGRITTAELARQYNISMESARLDLVQLCVMCQLRPIGDKKGRFYIRRDTFGPSENGHQITPQIGERGGEPVAGQQTIDPFTADI